MKISKIHEGWWWKCSKYELRDGCICPAPGAKWEQYDPWEAYQRALYNRKVYQPLYQNLLNLYSEIKEDVRSVLNAVPMADVFTGTPDKIALTQEGEKRLLAWCREHGLLGILLQRVAMVCLPFTSEKGRPLPDMYLKTSMGWTSSFSTRWTQRVKPGTKDLLGREIKPDKNAWPSPGVLLSAINNHEYRWEPLNKTWDTFFSRLPVRERTENSFPVPLTQEFWRMYVEPLDEFLGGISVLWSTMRGIKIGDPEKVFSERLNALVSQVNPVLTHDKGEFKQRWVSPSLLASYAMMILQDLTSNRRILTCPVCNNIFVTDAWQGTYCSSTCRNTAQKRAYRKRLKEDG